MPVDENDGGMLEESLGGCFYGEHTVVIAYR